MIHPIVDLLAIEELDRRLARDQELDRRFARDRETRSRG